MTIAPDAAASRLRDRLGVTATVSGALVTVEVPPDRWQALGRVAKDELGCLYFNWLSAIDGTAAMIAKAPVVLYANPQPSSAKSQPVRTPGGAIFQW